MSGLCYSDLGAFALPFLFRLDMGSFIVFALDIVASSLILIPFAFLWDRMFLPNAFGQSISLIIEKKLGIT